MLYVTLLTMSLCTVPMVPNMVGTTILASRLATSIWIPCPRQLEDGYGGGSSDLPTCVRTRRWGIGIDHIARFAHGHQSIRWSTQYSRVVSVHICSIPSLGRSLESKYNDGHILCRTQYTSPEHPIHRFPDCRRHSRWILAAIGFRGPIFRCSKDLAMFVLSPKSVLRLRRVLYQAARSIRHKCLLASCSRWNTCSL